MTSFLTAAHVTSQCSKTHSKERFISPLTHTCDWLVSPVFESRERVSPSYMDHPILDGCDITWMRGPSQLVRRAGFGFALVPKSCTSPKQFVIFSFENRRLAEHRHHVLIYLPCPENRQSIVVASDNSFHLH